MTAFAVTLLLLDPMAQRSAGVHVRIVGPPFLEALHGRDGLILGTRAVEGGGEEFVLELNVGSTNQAQMMIIQCTGSYLQGLRKRMVQVGEAPSAVSSQQPAAAATRNTWTIAHHCCTTRRQRQRSRRRTVRRSRT